MIMDFVPTLQRENIYICVLMWYSFPIKRSNTAKSRTHFPPAVLLICLSSCQGESVIRSEKETILQPIYSSLSLPFLDKLVGVHLSQVCSKRLEHLMYTEINFSSSAWGRGCWMLHTSLHWIKEWTNKISKINKPTCLSTVCINTYLLYK